MLKMTDCSSLQGSTTSSSSDVTTLTTASSWCSVSSSPRIRTIRLVRPHQRRVHVTAPNATPSFGFAIRGGKEFVTGFFVSHVEKHSEAEQKGLTVGDQIVRVNGYRVDDAVHKEFVQFIGGQNRLTMKIRGVGMLPMKEKKCDPLTWYTVKAAMGSPLYPENSLRLMSGRRNSRSKDVRVLLEVAPRTKLGLGICKGPDWKPGIFIQFTKEKSVAREAGLRPGDQILCVNSIDFSDVLFSEAVAVMKSSARLDMVVRTSVGCELFPGESSGYNSSASSVTGDQSPCWTDVSSKRLTVVREEPSLNGGANDHTSSTSSSLSSSTSVYAEVVGRVANGGGGGGVRLPPARSQSHEMNKTIIKLSESGTSINNTFIEDSYNASSSLSSSPPLPPPPPPPPPPPTAPCDAATDALRPTSIPPPPPPSLVVAATIKETTPSDVTAPPPQKVADICFVSRQSETKTVIVEVHSSDTNGKRPNGSAIQPLSAPPVTATDGRGSINDGNDSRASTMDTNMARTSSTHGSLVEELKKRKEMLRNVANSNNNNNHNRNGFIQQRNNMSDEMIATTQRPQKRHYAAGESLRQGCDQHSALMDEFKRAHNRMFRNGFKESDPQQEKEGAKDGTPIAGRDQRLDAIGARTSRTSEDRASTHVLAASSERAEDTPAYASASVHTKACGHRRPPPMSPIPDYDNIPVAAGCLKTTTTTTAAAAATARAHSGACQYGDVMRLKAVTIGGEYAANSNKSPRDGGAAADTLTKKFQDRQKLTPIYAKPMCQQSEKRSVGEVTTAAATAAATSNGILKNGTGRTNRGSAYMKPVEKSISFGNGI